MSQSTEGAILRKFGEMKRLIPIFAAVVALAGPLAAGGAAVAKEQGGDRGERSSERGGDRGPGNGGGGEHRGRERGGYRGPDGGYEAPGADTAAARHERPSIRAEEDRRPRTATAANPTAATGAAMSPVRPPTQRYAPSPRRGGYMPPPSGCAIQDHVRIACGLLPAASSGFGPPTATPWSAGAGGCSTSCPLASRASPSGSG